MPQQDRLHWDAVYRRRALEPYPAPDALLVAYAPAAAPDTVPMALDLAAGLCQNAVWLARQGYQVDAVDISRVALERGRAEMAMYNLRTVNTIPMDLEQPLLAENGYDLVCVFRFFQRSLFEELRAAVRPGGMVVYQTFNTRLLEIHPSSTRAYLVEPGELPGLFPGWDVLHDEDHGQIARYVGRKPRAKVRP